MAIILIGSIYGNNENRIDTSLFVQKLYLGISYMESNLEEDID